jgi:DNA-binding NarL/FixJ family response regulator
VHDSNAVIDSVLDSGAAAFVSKRTKIDPLIAAIRKAAGEQPTAGA